jgi:hypothetical protein
VIWWGIPAKTLRAIGGMMIYLKQQKENDTRTNTKIKG